MRIQRRILGIVAVLVAATVGLVAPSSGLAETQGTTTLVIRCEQADERAAQEPQGDVITGVAPSEARGMQRAAVRLPKTAEPLASPALVALIGGVGIVSLLLGCHARSDGWRRCRLVIVCLAVASLAVAAPAAALDADPYEDEACAQERSQASSARGSSASEDATAPSSAAGTSSAAARSEQSEQSEQDSTSACTADRTNETPTSPAATSTGEESAPTSPQASSMSVTLVANGPEQDDVIIHVPASGGSFPTCPFEYERHAFVGWATHPQETDAFFVPGEELVPEGHAVFYALWRPCAPVGQADGLDFSSCRLIVGCDERPTYGTLLSEHEGVYMLEFDNPIDAAWAYVDHRDEVAFMAPDIDVGIASPEQEEPQDLSEALLEATAVEAPLAPQTPPAGEVVADLARIDDAAPVEHGVVALIDTGVTGHADAVVESVSVIDHIIIDDNGHGTSMLDTMLALDPATKVVSIRALDKSGKGTAASVYAAIETAIKMDVKLINLSLYAPATQGNEAVEQALVDAYEAGITVVGAAGNDGKNAKWYVPGKVEQVLVMGSCDAHGTRAPCSNFGDTVDRYVPSQSTSVAAAKASAWLAAHGTFGQELACLDTDEARAALGFACDAAQDVPSNDADDEDASADETAPDPAPDASFTTAWTHPTLQAQAHYSSFGWSDWAYTDVNSPQSFYGAGLVYNNKWQNIENIAIRIGAYNSWTAGGSIEYRAYKQNLGYDSWQASPNSSPAATGGLLRVEGLEARLTGSIANAYDLSYKVYTLKRASVGRANQNSPCDDDAVCHRWFESSNGGYAGTQGRALAIENMRFWLTPKSHREIVQVRYQNANGSFGSYSNVVDGSYQTGATVSWSRAQDATYRAASISWTATGAATRQVTVYRRTATNTIQARYQNADGSYGAYKNVSSGTNYVGQVRSWSQAANATYVATSASITGTASNQTKQVSVNRQTYSVNINCLDPSGRETHADTAVHAALFDVRLDNGSWTQHSYNEPSGFKPRSGQKVTIGNIRVRPGYTLASVEGATAAGSGTYTLTVSGAATIVIKTKLANFSVGFNANGATLSGSSSYEKGFGTTVSAPTVTREGYDFVQWVPVRAQDESWVEVMYQSPMAAWFTNAATARECNALDLYARLGKLESLRANGRWEFLLESDQWPNKRMQWRQSSNPVTSSTVQGYEAVSLSWDASTFSGLATSASSKTLACGHNGSGLWWYAVGAYAVYLGGVPVVQSLGNASGVAYKPLRLYVKSDERLSTLGSSYTSGYGAGASIPVRAYNQRFKAQWRSHRLKVSYDLGGGTGAQNPATENWEYGAGKMSVAAVPDGLLRAGYIPLPSWRIGSPEGPEVQAGAQLDAQELAELAGKDLLAGDADVTLYANWEKKELRVIVPVALHYVAQEDGTLVGPDDGVAAVCNKSELPIRIVEKRIQVKEPYDASFGVTLQKDRLEPGESATLSDLVGQTSTTFVDETEVGCIHWTFAADTT